MLEGCPNRSARTHGSGRSATTSSLTYPQRALGTVTVFTGIVRGSESSRRDRRGVRSGLARSPIRAPTRRRVRRWGLGAIDGCCLTATKSRAAIAFHAVSETVGRTTLARLRAQKRCERRTRHPRRRGAGPVPPTSRTRRRRRPDPIRQGGVGRLRMFEAPDAVLRYTSRIDHLDGVSLTIAELAEDAFAVALVPHARRD